jgi:hypothetical protein
MGPVGKTAIGCLRVCLALFAGLVLFLYFTLFHETHVSYRYRLTISVESDGAAHSGSSVIQVDWRFWSKAFRGLVGGNPGHGSVIGRGAMVDLGARGTLVAALSGLPYDYCSARAIDLVSLAYNPVDRGRNCTIGHPLSVEGEKALAQKQGVAQLPLNGMPAFIWFPDKSDPALARKLDPADFSSVIGDSTRLVSAQIEITRDPLYLTLTRGCQLSRRCAIRRIEASATRSVCRR